MIKQNKIISLAIIGFVLGGILGVVVDAEQANPVTLAAGGGVFGFLAGWVWKLRSGGSEDSDSGASEVSDSGAAEDSYSGGTEDSDSGGSEDSDSGASEDSNSGGPKE